MRLTSGSSSSTYYYVTNLRGDVIAILNSSGTAVVEYTYDAWGNPISTTGSMATTLGATNPLRYRGYVYDEDTELYYLQSRYYNPTTGRFLNTDAFAATGQGVLGNNMFAYCGNNPINRQDSSGFAGVGVLSNTKDGFLRESGGAGLSGSWLQALLTTVSLSCLITSQKATSKLNDDAIAIAVTATTGNSAIYYPADFCGSMTSPKVWKQYPFPMDHDTATGWVISTALSGKYGKNASWGLYTFEQTDALNMAISLGGPLPCLHEKRIGERPHYHVAGMDLFGYFKHFHIWYGEEYDS